MDQERIDNDKTDEVMLPGFRFHPTDEELVGFYLRRKIQQKPLSIELIKQLDIYKYDPWDLPKLATTGEKEWYFYCPRDRKYRNSSRPNRVTGAGFWKATGTDRPIYSSEGSKCIGLKKSLVFYKGRAAKGIKTDWMMHEFRLPSVSDSVSPKKYLDKNIPANEAWAICRIFKKANSSAQRALSHSWVSPVFDIASSDTINPSAVNNVHFSSSNITMASKINSPLQFGFCNDIEQSSIASFSPLHFPPCKPVYQMENKPCQLSSNGVQLNTSYKISSTETSEPAPKCAITDASSLLLDMSTSIFGEFVKGSENMDFSTLHEQCNGFSATATENMQGNLCHAEEAVLLVKDQNVGQLDDQWGILRSMGYPYSFPLTLPDAWKSNLPWDSSPCPSELILFLDGWPNERYALSPHDKLVAKIRKKASNPIQATRMPNSSEDWGIPASA
ncbi:hypothetical protein Pfo_009501 [Paulownia fortunei]|nr:hypothetical protein Pfo_009501 [Paulownia fortunei]